MTTWTGMVGSAHPGPISNSTQPAAMCAAMHAANNPIGTDAGGANQIHAATTTRKEPPVASPERRSLTARSRRIRRRDALTSSAAAAMSTSGSRTVAVTAEPAERERRGPAGGGYRPGHDCLASESILSVA